MAIIALIMVLVYMSDEIYMRYLVYTHKNEKFTYQSLPIDLNDDYLRDVYKQVQLFPTVGAPTAYDIKQDYSHYTFMSDQMKNGFTHLDDLMVLHKTKRIGGQRLFPYTREVITKYLVDNNLLQSFNRVCEYGFGAGHFAYYMINKAKQYNNHHLHYLSYDLCQYGMEEQSYEFINSEFPNSLELIIGDAVQQSDHYWSSHASISAQKCDLVFFDIHALGYPGLKQFISQSKKSDTTATTISTATKQHSDISKRLSSLKTSSSVSPSIAKPLNTHKSILMVDWCETNDVTQRMIYTRAKQNGLIEEIGCFEDGISLPGCYMTTCLAYIL